MGGGHCLAVAGRGSGCGRWQHLFDGGDATNATAGQGASQAGAGRSPELGARGIVGSAQSLAHILAIATHRREENLASSPMGHSTFALQRPSAQARLRPVDSGVGQWCGRSQFIYRSGPSGSRNEKCAERCTRAFRITANLANRLTRKRCCWFRQRTGSNMSPTVASERMVLAYEQA